MALKELLDEYEELKKRHFHIDMTRGKPSKEQLDLSLSMMDALTSDSVFLDANGNDVRNYGTLDGIPECKRLMSQILGVPEKNVIVFGNSSLNAMYDQIARSYSHGVCGNIPWSKLNRVKWLCPVPGYDRHFSITEHFGIEMISIPMNNEGPDMDVVEELVKDEMVKGIWCVPKYSNPSGIIYSNETIRRFAKLKPAAKDFRVYWDNAYVLHDFFEEKALLNVFDEAKKNNNEDLFYIFVSTSKLSFPGGGIAAIGTSDKNIIDIIGQMKFQTIGFDKINQLRHVKYFKDLDGLREHAKKHGKILQRKFDIVTKALSLLPPDVFEWTRPSGGYFVTVRINGLAKEIIERCKWCGVVLTESGSTHPYHYDETNSFIRIAPSFINDDELEIAMRVFVLSASIEFLKKEQGK